MLKTEKKLFSNDMPCRNAEYDAMNYHTRKRVAYLQENMGIFGATQ